MATYKDSGVDIALGDKCSAIAYACAKNTFAGRKGMIGEPVLDEGGFAGAIDMGDYYLIQNDDGVGSKIRVAEMMGKYDGLGYDLVAMVADDAICVGAETISITNTLDVDKIDENKISSLMSGLEKACLEQKIVVPGGEIAELGNMLNGYVWNATSVGIVEKNKMITGEKIEVGDKIVGLPSRGIRSNGFSLVRHILSEKYGEEWGFQKYNDSTLWGDAVLIPSKIYSGMLLEIHGRYGKPAKSEIGGIVHVTGGGIYGNISRVLKKKGLKSNLNNLPEIPELFARLMELGSVSEEEAYKTWNMGVAMIVITKDPDVILSQFKDATIIGEVV